jgi:hypothetical protein
MKTNLSSSTTPNTVKVNYNGETYKFRNIVNYNDLLKAISTSFGYKILKCKFYYSDEEDDNILITNNEDFKDAVEYFSPKTPKLVLQKFVFKSDGKLNVSSWNDKDTLLSDFDGFSNISFSDEGDEKEDNVEFQLDIKDTESLLIVREESLLTTWFGEKVVPSEKQKSDTEQHAPKCPSVGFLENSNVMSSTSQRAAIMEERNSSRNIQRSNRIQSHSFLDLKEHETPKPNLPSPLINWKWLTPRQIWTEQEDFKKDNLKVQIQAQISEEISNMNLKDLIKKQMSGIVPEIISQISQNLNSPRNFNFRPKNEIHQVRCSGCNSKTIKGACFKCIVWSDFNLWEDWEAQFHHGHALLKINKPEEYDRIIRDLQLENKFKPSAFLLN